MYQFTAKKCVDYTVISIGIIIITAIATMGFGAAFCYITDSHKDSILYWFFSGMIIDLLAVAVFMVIVLIGYIIRLVCHCIIDHCSTQPFFAQQDVQDTQCTQSQTMTA